MSDPSLSPELECRNTPRGASGQRAEHVEGSQCPRVYSDERVEPPPPCNAISRRVRVTGTRTPWTAQVRRRSCSRAAISAVQTPNRAAHKKACMHARSKLMAPVLVVVESRKCLTPRVTSVNPSAYSSQQL
jgi:hypothetical protein